MILSQFFVYFIFYSFLGWVWETIYCTIKEKHFANRGFLFGPVCPIYGSCVIVVQLLYRFAHGWVNESMPLWELFLICAVGSAIGEYGTSWYLEKRFHARWWDYSTLPLNIKGRICLPVTLCFGAAGVVIVRYLLPAISGMESGIPPLVFEGLSLGLMAVFGADFALTEASLKPLLARIENAEKEFTSRAEDAYQLVSSTPQQIENKIHAMEDELSNRAHAFAGGLSYRQKYILNSIKSFRPLPRGRHRFQVGQRIKDALADLKKRETETVEKIETGRKNEQS
ncbi:MAG: putative ABC transporter permease [Eubacterium sp.]|nr:putative ABC transporter permease [Eubacterium sp.]